MERTATMIATCFGLRLLIAAIVGVLVVGSIPTTCEGFEVYFPVTSVRVRLPTGEKSQSIFSKIPIGRFQVLATSNNSLAPAYVYSLENNADGMLQIHNKSGELFIGERFAELTNTTRFTISASASASRGASVARPGPGAAARTPHMSLEVEPLSNEAFCDSLENVCFWTSVRYSIVEHNDAEVFRPIRVGSLNPRGSKYLCPHIDLSYRLVNENKYLTIKDNVLYTKLAVDHESLNVSTSGGFDALVSCLVTTGPNETHEFTRPFKINVVDSNDNGPVLQDKKVYSFAMEDPHFRVNDSIGEKIIFIDNDTVETNSHLTYQIHNDTYDLLRPICNAYETDHTGSRKSIISCQITFARNGILSVSPYCVTLEARDRTLSAQQTQTARALVCLRADVSKIHETDRPRAMALRGGRQHRKPQRIVEEEEAMLGSAETGYGHGHGQSVPSTYPKDVYVYRTAMTYHRIAQLENSLDLIRTPGLRFAIAEDRSGVFGITASAGIVYVKNTSALQNAVETIYFLNVTWHDTHPRSFVINVHLAEGRPANATCDHKEKSRSQTCAQIKYRRQCEHFCGLATGGGPCEWRGSNGAMFSRNFASCVPDARHCPDNVCDPLEELDPSACPQDCVVASKIMGPHSANDNKRGILAASGTCVCEDNGKCFCAPLDDDEPRPKRKRKNELPAKLENVRKLEHLDEALGHGHGHDHEERGESVQVAGIVCGTSCMIIAITCPLVFVVLIVCLVVSRRNLLRKAKGKASLAGPKTLRDECDVSKGDLPLMSLENGFKFDPADSKWEFPRERLVLDTVLGEGEFGKVVKAFATDIAELPGVTTVAVKMLKSGANSVEYMALLSEFQLLQEVSHPNVIKLLGACTQGESPLIIIEYARHGSLRSYLRLSRKIECAGVDFTDGVEPVTVKDILSFAWQICRGMAYLTEIKLVHRDLAARNVLLADGKICKISDFGLTRDVYEDDAYLKRSRDRVPVKWMAPESLADHVYTTKSDVWAFGVLCWELITLGASPYPGVPPQDLYHLLRTGYRMERPENCSEDIYSIVRTCWTDDPNARPSFKYLASEFEKLLGNNAKYIELASHAVSNPLYCSDEVKLLGSPSRSKLTNITSISQLANDLGEPDCLDHLWRPPKMGYDTNDCPNSRDLSVNFSPEFQPPPGYDLPRPLIEANTTEQVLRYENDLRFPLNIRKSVAVANPYVGKFGPDHYSVPVKRGRSYMDMTNKTLIPDNLDNGDFEKHISKNISFRFSSLLNLNEHEDGVA